jgi:hypothetical protein
MVGEVNAVSEHDPTRIAGRGFIPATCIFFGRSIRLATLDIAIESAAKEIGAVHGIPDKAVVGSRNSAVGHGHNSSQIFAARVMTMRRIGVVIAAYYAEIMLDVCGE